MRRKREIWDFRGHTLRGAAGVLTGSILVRLVYYRIQRQASIREVLLVIYAQLYCKDLQLLVLSNCLHPTMWHTCTYFASVFPLINIRVDTKVFTQTESLFLGYQQALVNLYLVSTSISIVLPLGILYHILLFLFDIDGERRRLAFITIRPRKMFIQQSYRPIAMPNNLPRSADDIF